MTVPSGVATLAQPSVNLLKKVNPYILATLVNFLRLGPLASTTTFKLLDEMIVECRVMCTSNSTCSNHNFILTFPILNKERASAVHCVEVSVSCELSRPCYDSEACRSLMADSNWQFASQERARFISIRVTFTCSCS